MDHVAIMKRSSGLIEDILSRKKKIESRWYVNRIAPWGKIKKGDRVFFKYSGDPVTACAEVLRVKQYENLNKELFEKIAHDHGDEISMKTTTYNEYYEKKRYCILVFLKEPRKIKPFEIDKKGYGISSAWMCVGDIANVVKTG